MRILHAIYSMERAQGGPPQVCGHLAGCQAQSNDVAIASYTAPNDDVSLIPPRVQSEWLGRYGLTEKLLGVEAKTYFKQQVPRFDVLHIHNVWEALLLAGAQAATRSDVPYVITPHGMLDPWSLSQKKTKKKLAMFLGRRKMLENAKFIHVLNLDEEKGIRKLGIRNRCEIIPNGVSLKSIDPYLDSNDAYKNFPQLHGRPFVLFLSRMHFKKGLDILANAISPFFQTNKNWQLVIAGPDDGVEDLFCEQVAKLGIEDRVHLVGPIYGNLKYSLLAACDLFCLPSRQEGFSVAILEAMAASKPVIISRHCHFNEVETVKAGVVTSLDSVEISDQICKLAASTQLREDMGQRARLLVEEKYTWSSVASIFEQHFENL